MIYFKMPSCWGPMVAGIDDYGRVAGLWFEGQKYFPNITVVYTLEGFNQVYEASAMTAETRLKITTTFTKLKTQMMAYENGTLTKFDLPLKPQGTAFQLVVWHLLCEIPFGQMTTYGEVSKKVATALGKETMSAQAVGGAIGRNPISVIIPCHRVVASSGSLTGYAGGLDKKSALLKHEGAI